MDILQSLLGSPDPPEPADSESTIDLPEDDYTVAVPVAVRQPQLAAFQTVIEAERDTPPLDGPGADLILDAVNEARASALPDGESVDDYFDRIRSEAEDIITVWQGQVTDELDVVFLPVGAIFRLRRVLHLCEKRADSEDDPFTLPDEFVEAVSLLKRLQAAEEETEAVLVHKNRVPNTA